MKCLHLPSEIQREKWIWRREVIILCPCCCYWLCPLNDNLVPFTCVVLIRTTSLKTLPKDAKTASLLFSSLLLTCLHFPGDAVLLAAVHVTWRGWFPFKEGAAPAHLCKTGGTDIQILSAVISIPFWVATGGFKESFQPPNHDNLKPFNFII